MKKRLKQLLICVPFLLIICVIGARTVYDAIPGFLETRSSIMQVTASESLLKEKLYGKNTFLEFAGATLKLLNRSLVGDGQFYKDSDGIMHLLNGEQSAYLLEESTKYLGQQLKNRGIPFLVCQIAERGTYGDSLSKFFDSVTTAYIEPLKTAAAAVEAQYLDYTQVFDNAGYLSTDIFLKTDIHYTTNAEFLILQNVIEKLELECGLSFGDKKTVLDINNYTIEKYPFIGNLVASIGQIYAGTDTFEYYLPKFQTSLHLVNPSSGLQKDGSFEQVCMNGFRDWENQSVRTYRITDYLQWPSPYYRITNDLVHSNDVLVIGCSMRMRTIAYLSLMCRSVTVLDPRYFNGIDYLSQALNSDYDAVILFASNYLLDGIGGYDASILSFEIESLPDDKFDLHVTVSNDGSMPWTGNIYLQAMVPENGLTESAFLDPDTHVVPGEEYTFTFESLDQDILTSLISVQMQKNGQFAFGNTATIVVPLGEYSSEVISQRFEGSDLLVTVKNTSSVTWKSEYQVKCGLFSDGNDTGLRAIIPYGTQVLPGESITFRFENVKPQLMDRSEIVMLQESVAYFPERTAVELSN